MNTSIVVALIAGAVSAVGWMVNHILTDRRDREQKRTEALLKHVERQLEELYGPMAFLLYEARRAYQDLLDTLKRDYVFIKGK